MMDNIIIQESTGKAILNGAMAHIILVNFTIIRYRAKELTHGRMGVFMTENGIKIKCMEMELLLGQMEEST